jgi:hypothetical protein
MGGFMRSPGFAQLFKLLKGSRTALASVVLVILVPVVTFSESALRQGVTGWLDDCLIVISKEVTKESPTRVAVRLHTSGALPKVLALNFRANDGLIHEIRYFSTDDPSGLSPYTSLSLHPMNGQYCPGALCEGVLDNRDGERRRSVELVDPFAESDQRFNVEFGAKSAPEALSVFVMQRKGATSSCRVQNENAFNWYFRQDKGVKFLTTLLILGVLLGVVAQLKAMKGEN